MYPNHFFYPTHRGPLTITENTTAHANSNMRIMHTEEVRLFSEVTRVEQDLVQQIVGMVEESYLSGIRNRTMNSINNTVACVLTHLQDNYGHLIPRELLERDDIFKKTIYKPCDPITTVFSAVKEPFGFSDITGTSYTQLQSVSIASVIIHRTGRFRLAICEWNCMPELQKTWVQFKQFFWKSHQELI